MIRHRTRTVLLQAVALIVTTLLVALSPAAAEEKRFGLGLIVGEPTGVSGKYLLGEENAIDLAVAWNLSGDNDFTLHADYLWNKSDLIQVGSEKMLFYFGVGVRMELRDNKSDKFGVRVPIGVSYRFVDPKFLELFGEVAPVVDLAPSTKMDLNVGIGARFYFF
jgi:hypothetical protein